MWAMGVAHALTFALPTIAHRAGLLQNAGHCPRRSDAPVAKTFADHRPSPRWRGSNMRGFRELGVQVPITPPSFLRMATVDERGRPPGV